ncbi:acyl-CoA dehydrogenase [Methylosinus sporium]|uniref:Acyl-CoA dehydrogenase n=1 Tax=Methylosinus sporium TaxID=428 RepID=A0A549SM42_METSR|nr:MULTISPECIES: acyl-CoA dehydrogenase family protein [Methylosinus]MBU3887761.1 acyl-CoA/acyl-ACP dehydrogenase [Methylosinus sp. KRF6]TRL30698.1 acyl-CoA dehydrogenase [Methylosinus sporium]
MNAPLDRGADVVTTAARHADDVDRNGRFPIEAVRALKDARLLSLLIPVEFGGGGASLFDVAEICTSLGQRCASTAMIFAMHQIKVSSLVAHGRGSAWHEDFMRRLCDEQLLLGSATTEGGVGGNMRNSICAFERDGATFRIAKEGALISYGAYSDAILVTARRAADAPPSDQQMAVLEKSQYRLERTGGWDALGMRGTCSEGFTFSGEAPVEQIFTHDFAEIASESMLATAHLLWSAVWFGVASDALSRAQSFVRKDARRHPNGPAPGALRLAEATAKLQLMRSNIVEGLKRFAKAQQNEDDLNSMSFAVAMNNIKIGSSQLSIEIINHALLIAGIAGYKNDTPFSVGRHMRDALSAQVMISNDRIFTNLSNMLLAQRIDQRLGE